MATKVNLGIKRTCQNAACGARYDLARDPITCPICAAAYEIRIAPPVVERRSGRKLADLQRDSQFAGLLWALPCANCPDDEPSYWLRRT